MTGDLPTRAEAKTKAKRLRDSLAGEGTSISHSEALERVAQRYGFRDWNALSAASEQVSPEGWHAGGHVQGRYLSQPFAAKVLSAEELRPGWYRLVLDLEEAVDVVRFEGFSNWRKQLRVEVGPEGHSKERTSDGIPHVVLDR